MVKSCANQIELYVTSMRPNGTQIEDALPSLRNLWCPFLTCSSYEEAFHDVDLGDQGDQNQSNMQVTEKEIITSETLYVWSNKGP